MTGHLPWGDQDLTWTFEWDAETPVHLAAVRLGDREHRVHRVPLVEVLTADHGHVPASDRLAHTELGSMLRYAGHDEADDRLVIRQEAEGVRAELELERLGAARALRARVTVTNTGDDEPLVLRAVTTWSAGFTARNGDRGPRAAAPDHHGDWARISGRSDWLGEGRWTRTPLRGPDFPRLAEHLTGHDPRSAFAVTSDGTWSTGGDLPVAAVASEASALALAWQVEHNGAWRWEVAEDTDGGYVALSGPTEADASWTRVLAPGESFDTVPATIAAGADVEAAVAALTDFRRAARRAHPDNAAMPVVFNDYMNTLDGDPTTEKLLPLIAAAAAAGAEVFCIDAGWYDDSGHWWDTVGEWLPSTTRFPSGLGEVIDAIRDAGMVPGLWLEPEVIGVRSPIADELPLGAFLLRHGRRIVEHHRYHLDLRHPAAIAHLDAVVDRLVADFGIGFFKFDYNINPGTGTDHDADSTGDGLLAHNRAHLAWLDRLLDRHPGLVIENCSSGAMRMDFAIMSRLQMQSTSDQQDFTKYPPIAAAAPFSLLPEQAASWAYPQPDMDDEEIAFCLVTGLLGRFYVSGYLNRMTPGQLAQVSEAVAVAKGLRAEITAGHPTWPLGLPGWTDPWVALGLRGERGDLVSVWRRPGTDGHGTDAPGSAELRLPHLAGRDLAVETVFPTALPAWRTDWDAATGTLTVHADDAPVAARTLRLVPGAHRPVGAPASPDAAS
ncbi:glycoside hydrolase family 36 protein [Agromyces sp. MMS24-K17]|uniref:glycoside hydrolase family 36 protein n=1 Tax=Agromyces sp. MMS24-K17 TaxID=3372850 RepID=UPI003754DC79